MERVVKMNVSTDIIWEMFAYARIAIILVVLGQESKGLATYKYVVTTNPTSHKKLKKILSFKFSMSYS